MDSVSSTADLFEQQQFTLEGLIRSGAAWLEGFELEYGHGTDNALDEAAWLAMEACDLSPLQAPDDYQQLVTESQLAVARDWFRQRAQEQVPVAYLTGRCWFAGLEFVVDRRALIPRSPIAELIQQGFHPWLLQPPAKVLDLCCGGGCIGLAIAHYFPDTQVDGADLSADALALARINCDKHELGARVDFYQGDLFAALPAGCQYDLIVSNPPYVDRQDMQILAAEYKHEPELGLAAGADGLDIAGKILQQCKNYLTDNGLLVVEVGNSEAALEAAMPGLNFIWLEFEFGGRGVFAIHASDLPGV